MAKRIAIAGATGAVGTLVRQILEQRDFPYASIKFLASKRSVGKTLTFKGKQHTVELLEPKAFDDVDIVIGSTPDEVAAEFVPWAVERGTIVVDESGYHRMMEDVPLVVPEVNADAVKDHKGIIASPNCSTTQMVVAMKPLHDVSPIKRVVVSTYQSTSGAGVVGQEDLTEGTKCAIEGNDYDYKAFSHPIAFNVIPQIGSHKADGYTSEEVPVTGFCDDSLVVVLGVAVSCIGVAAFDSADNDWCRGACSFGDRTVHGDVGVWFGDASCEHGVLGTAAGG